MDNVEQQLAQNQMQAFQLWTNARVNVARIHSRKRWYIHTHMQYFTVYKSVKVGGWLRSKKNNDHISFLQIGISMLSFFVAIFPIEFVVCVREYVYFSRCTIQPRAHGRRYSSFCRFEIQNTRQTKCKLLA